MLRSSRLGVAHVGPDWNFVQLSDDAYRDYARGTVGSDAALVSKGKACGKADTRQSTCLATAGLTPLRIQRRASESLAAFCLRLVSWAERQGSLCCDTGLRVGGYFPATRSGLYHLEPTARRDD